MTKTAIVLADQNKPTNHPVAIIDADFDFLTKNDPGFKSSLSLKTAYSDPAVKTILIVIYVLSGESGVARRKLGLFYHDLDPTEIVSRLKVMCAEVGIDLKTNLVDFRSLSTVKRADRDFFKSLFRVKGDDH